MKSSETIFIVTGETGEYEDHKEWQVAAFREKSMAKTFARECNKEAKRIFRNIRKHDKIIVNYDERVKNGGLKPHKYDSKFETEYTGTKYSYQELPIVDEF